MIRGEGFTTGFAIVVLAYTPLSHKLCYATGFSTLKREKSSLCTVSSGSDGQKVDNIIIMIIFNVVLCLLFLIITYHHSAHLRVVGHVRVSRKIELGKINLQNGIRRTVQHPLKPTCRLL